LNRLGSRRFLLATIYASYIGLGLPYFVLGAAWPAMRTELGLPVSYIGVLNTAMMLCTMAAALLNGRLMSRFYSGNVFCVAYAFYVLTALCLSFAKTGAALTMLLIPLGLCMGTVDSGNNLFVSLNYSSRGMMYMHFSWGVGAMSGPFVILYCVENLTWQSAYLFVSILGGAILIPLIYCRAKGYWIDIRLPDAPRMSERKHDGNLDAEESALPVPAGQRPPLCVVASSLGVFFCQSGCGGQIGNLTSSYLRDDLGTTVDTGGMAVMVYLGAMTVGRLLFGFFVSRAGTQAIIRVGLALGMGGSILSACVPTPAGVFCGVAVVGFGIGPVFPCMVQETQMRFWGGFRKHMVGYQVAAAQIGSASITFFASVYYGKMGMQFLFPVIATLFAASIVFNEYVNRHTSLPQGR
jgi:MFS family permease